MHAGGNHLCPPGDGYPKAADHSADQRQPLSVPSRLNVATAALESLHAPREATIPYGIVHDVIDLSGAPKLILSVIDHLVRAERFRESQVGGAAHGCDVCPKML